MVKYLLLILTMISTCFFFNQAAAEKSVKTVYVIPVQGPVEPGMAAYIKRSLRDIPEKENCLIIFRMDTFGGRVDSALDIVDTISGISKAKTATYVEKRAISAGALISMASSVLYMKKNTIMGDCAPIINTSEGMQMAGEKVQTVLRAKFRALAKKNNYPVILAESMVTQDMEVYEVVIDGKKQYLDKVGFDDLTKVQKKKITSKRTVVAKGKLLTMDDEEAARLGFNTQSVDSLEDVIEMLGFKDAAVIEIKASWSEDLVRFLQPFLSILMLIGIAALYTEIKAPGFGFPGVIGILCLVLVFFNQYLVGLADYTELLIISIGLLLLAIEVLVLPGFGIAGITGLAAVCIGLVLSFQGFVLPDPDLPWESALLLKNLARVFGSFVLAFLLSLFVIRFVLPRFSKVFDGPYLDATLADSHLDSPVDKMLAAGSFGVARTDLKPTGKAVINGKKVEVMTRGDFIAKGSPIEIESIENNRILVKRTKVREAVS